LLNFSKSFQEKSPIFLNLKISNSRKNPSISHFLKAKNPHTLL